MAVQAELSCRYVKGMSRGSGYVVGGPLFESLRHAWNLVQIEGVWYPVDVSWAALPVLEGVPNDAVRHPLVAVMSSAVY